MDRARNEFFSGSRLSDDLSKLGPNFLLKVKPLLRFLISILCSLLVLQCVLNCNRYLTGHLLEQDDIVFLKNILRTPTQHQNAERTVAANERKITAGHEAFLDHTLINKLALRIAINFRILADLFEAIERNALGLPHYLTRDRTIHWHQRSLAERASRVGIV